MKISVIIPTYNSEDTIVECIKSIYKQKEKTEVIVVDDHSTDKTVERIINSFRDKNIKILKNKKNMGGAYCRNLGLRLCHHNFVLFIDSDICLTKNSIKKMIDGIKNGNYDISFPKILYPNKKLMYPLFKYEIEYPYISACFLIKKSSTESLDELFDENFNTFLEDYDFFIRCKIFSLRANYVKNAYVIHMKKNKTNYKEKRFFLENRNLVYGIIKYMGIKNITYSPFKLKSLFKNFICGIFNFSWFEWSSYDRDTSFFNKIKIIKSNNERITNKSNIFLIFLFGYALINVLFNIRALIAKKQRLKNKLKYIEK